MFLINKQNWHYEELTSSLIMHAAVVKMQIQIEMSFSILIEYLMKVLHISEIQRPFFTVYDLISREQVLLIKLSISIV